MNKIAINISLVSVILLAIGFMFFNRAPSIAVGSTIVGQEYTATSTKSFGGVSLPTLTQLKTGPGSLGSVVITGAAAGTINFYDATTSNVNLRTGNVASSTIFLTTIPNSAAAGTYTFDVTYSTGLLYEFTGTAPTSTVTYR